MTRLRRFILNGLLITAVSLLIRAVSVAFNVYVTNRIGAIAMGVFTLIMTVYGFSVTVATSGIGFATTRLIAEEQGRDLQDEDARIRCTVWRCTIYALCFSVGSAVALFILSPFIGTNVLHDLRVVKPLRVLALTLPTVSVSSVFSGYFIARRRVYKNAVVQTLGQIMKIFLSVFFLSLPVGQGVEGGCLAIIYSNVITEYGSFIIHGCLFLAEQKKGYGKDISERGKKQIQGAILRTSLPMAFSAYIRSGLVALEHILIPIGLEKSGNSKDHSLAAYGTVHSVAFPLVLFPAAISASFAGLLIPEIAEAQGANDQKRVHRIIQLAFRSVMLFSIGTGGILFFYSDDIANNFLNNSEAGTYIRMIAPLVPVMYLDTVVDSILKGLGEQVYCISVNIVDSLLSVILVCILLPKMGIGGYILTVYFTETVNAFLSLIRLLKFKKIKIHPMKQIVMPLIFVVSSTCITRILIQRYTDGVQSASQLMAHLALNIVFYLLFLSLAGCFSFNKKSKRNNVMTD